MSSGSATQPESDRREALKFLGKALLAASTMTLAACQRSLRRFSHSSNDATSALQNDAPLADSSISFDVSDSSYTGRDRYRTFNPIPTLFMAGSVGPNGLFVPDSLLVQLQLEENVLVIGPWALSPKLFVRVVSQGGDRLYLAVSAICTHRECPLTAEPNTNSCECHGSMFDIYGKVLIGPARRPLERFTTTAVVGGIMLTLS